jgi:hypothetical protein
MLLSHVVRLPESFRGGCSFGAGHRPISPDMTVANRWEKNTALPSLSTQLQ